MAQDKNHGRDSSRPRYFPMPPTGGVPLPFSEAVKLGDTLYVSGQIGIFPGSLTLEAGGIGPEARRAIKNLKAILERHGSSLAHVVKCTVFLADISEWPAFNRSEEHTSELQSLRHLVCRLLLVEKG